MHAQRVYNPILWRCTLQSADTELQLNSERVVYTLLRDGLRVRFPSPALELQYGDCAHRTETLEGVPLEFFHWPYSLVVHSGVRTLRFVSTEQLYSSMKVKFQSSPSSPALEHLVCMFF